MELNRHGNLVGQNYREYSMWRLIKLTNKMTICPACNTERVKCRSPESKMVARAKVRAKAQGIPFDIDVTDINIPDVCPVLGIKLKIHTGKSGAFKDSPSLDKIIPELGYVKGNVQVMSQLANQMR